MLLCAWVWSIAGIAMLGPGVHYSFDGAEMFYGYYMILAFPLLVIVPYGAFRSLAGEREDRTFELLSITTLSPRQIVSGKLASAVVQMVVYLSAVSPCLTFTYMLRGIDIVSIVFILVYVCAGSLAFSLIALLLATVSRERHWQVVISLTVVVALCFGFVLSCAACYELLRSGSFPVDQRMVLDRPRGRSHRLCQLFPLFFCAAAAQLTFASDNRSTPLRICMLTQQALAGWIAFSIWETRSDSQFFSIGIPLIMGLTAAAVHWSLMGMFLVGESPNLRRACSEPCQKRLRDGRDLSWLFPGPGRGYVFVLANMAAAVAMALLSMLAWEALYSINPMGFRGPRSINWLTMGILALGYMAFYLGLGKLIVAWLCQYSVAGAISSVLVHVLLVLLGCGVPLVIHLMSDFRMSGYNLLHVFNPFWSMAELVEPGRRLIYGTSVPLYCVWSRIRDDLPEFAKRDGRDPPGAHGQPNTRGGRSSPRGRSSARRRACASQSLGRGSPDRSKHVISHREHSHGPVVFAQLDNRIAPTNLTRLNDACIDSSQTHDLPYGELTSRRAASPNRSRNLWHPLCGMSLISITAAPMRRNAGRLANSQRSSPGRPPVDLRQATERACRLQETSTDGR